MSMPKLAILTGALLIIQGVGFYVGTTSKSTTALIPCFIGLPILVLGALAHRPQLRKHAMHAAAALAALGLLAAFGRIATAGLRLSPASASLVIMVLLTGGFLACSIKSFIDARRKPG